MAKLSKNLASSDEALSDGSNPSEDEQVNQPMEEDMDEEELEAVARSASSADEDDAAPAEEDGDPEEDQVLIYVVDYFYVYYCSCELMGRFSFRGFTC